MKIKNILLILLTIIVLSGIITVVYAEGTGGGTGTGSGSGGTGSGGGQASGAWWDLGEKALNNTKSYRIDLVYKNPNRSDRQILKTIVVNCGDGYSSAVRQAINNYAANNASDGKVTTSGRWAEVACAVKNNLTTQLSNSGYFSQNNDAVIKDLLNDMGVSRQQLTQRQDINPGRINSYGYRFLIQQITLWGNGSKRAAVPRKEAAANGINGQSVGDAYFGGTNGSLAVTGLYQDDIFTDRDDIGIRNAMSNRLIYSKSNFADWYNGTGYHIIWFYNPYSGFDYSIDAACENCDNNNENGSYFIQDTTDWEAILSSPYSTIENAKTYYKKKIGGCEVFCREEYRITFPNANNQITTEAGRFFTVNKLGGVMYSAGVPNFKQIKIEKVRECRATGGNQQSCLASFASTAKSKTGNSAGETGTIKLTYKEDYKDSKYNTTLELNENKNRTISKEDYVNSSISGSNVMLKSTVIKYYELPDETYQWVNIRDGVSSLEKPTADLKHFLDVGTSNLPISHDNYSKTSEASKGAEVTFDYSLPTNSEDPYTLIKKAFNAKNDYFLDSSAKPTDNIYAKAKKGELNSVEQEQITNSACAKLFGYGTSKYNSCVNARTSNKAGNCYTQVTADGKYKCDVNVCPEGQNVVVKCENGKQKLVCSDEPTSAEECPGDTGKKICKIENGKYYGQNGKEVSKEEYLVECPQVCKVVDGKYYGKNGQLTTRKQYEAECPDKCAVNCEAGYCCPDLDMVCPTKDENGMWSCPGRGGNKIIYRPIDLNNPFPGQTNYNRATAANWCAYNVETGKTNCKSTNGVATTHIQNNRSTDNENVYNLTPLYEVDLDPTIINIIRGDNKNTNYDDFDLNCTNEKACYSNFLEKYKKQLNLKGVCANKSDLATCAESRR